MAFIDINPADGFFDGMIDLKNPDDANWLKQCVGQAVAKVLCLPSDEPLMSIGNGNGGEAVAPLTVAIKNPGLETYGFDDEFAKAVRDLLADYIGEGIEAEVTINDTGWSGMPENPINTFEEAANRKS